MTFFPEIRPPAPPYIAPCNRVLRALTPSQPRCQNQNQVDIANAALKKISENSNSLHDAQRSARNLALATLLRAHGMKELGADEILRLAQNVHTAHQAMNPAFVAIKGPPKNFW